MEAHVPVVAVALQEGVEGELEAGHRQVNTEYDPHPLTGEFQEVSRLSPAGGDAGYDGHGEGEMVDDEAGDDVGGNVESGLCGVIGNYCEYHGQSEVRLWVRRSIYQDYLMIRFRLGGMRVMM